MREMSMFEVRFMKGYTILNNCLIQNITLLRTGGSVGLAPEDHAGGGGFEPSGHTNTQSLKKLRRKYCLSSHLG